MKFQSVTASAEAILSLELLPVAPSAGSHRVTRYDRSRNPDPLIDEQLEEVSEDWLEMRHMKETGFIAGHFSLEELAEGLVFVLGDRNRIEAFSFWLPYRNGKAAVLDILRRRRDAPEQTMETLLMESMLLLRDSGFEEASITPLTMDRAHITAFKPAWTTRYLVHARGANIAKIERALRKIGTMT
jgi:lysylphosphatidylglycerol synthetase-like protein (DUF2156 family)